MTQGAPFPSPPTDYIRWKQRLDVPGAFYRFRRAFDLRSVPARACLRITGFTLYQAFVNGRSVGRGPLQSGRACATYDVFDVTRGLTPGRNVIAVHLLAGLYGEMHLDPAAWIGCGLFADLVDGEGKVILASDGAWKCDLDRTYALGRPRRNVWRPLFESVDARLDEPGWREADFDDSAWPPCRAGRPWPDIAEFERRPEPGFEFETDERFAFVSAGRVRWRGSPDEFFWTADESLYEPLSAAVPGVTGALSEGASFQPVTVEAEAGAASFFRVVSREYALGRPFMEIEADEGATVDIVWAERQVGSGVMLSPFARMANWARYVARRGRQTFTLFDLHGFRELQFIVQPGRGKVRFLRVGVERQWAMRCLNGGFDASDSRYGGLWRAGARTVAMVTGDYHYDNTFREQAPWSGDQEWTKMGAYVSEGPHPLTRRQLRQLLKGQTRDGRIVSPYPHSFPFGRMLDAQRQKSTGDYLPCHALGFILSMERHYQHTADADLVAEAFPHLERQIDELGRYGSRGILDLGRIPDAWIWVDWKGLRDRTAPMNALWGAALAAMGRLAVVAGQSPAAWSERFTAFVPAFRAAFWDAEKNLFVDRPFHRPDLGENLSQLTQAVAVCSGLLPESCDRARLTADLTALDGRLGVATPPMQGFVLSSLEALSAEERIHGLLERQWLKQQILDLGTLPEFWADQANAVQSLCQGGGPMISWALTRYVLGIRPVEPGYRRFEVRPAPGALAWAEGVCPTPFGPIRVRWERSGAAIHVRTAAPEGCVEVKPGG